MYRTSRQNLTVLLAAAAMAALAIGCGNLQSGSVIEVTEDSVTVVDEASFTQTTYKVGPDANIVRDGEPAALADIRPGDDVSVTVTEDAEGNQVATFVSAESNGGADEAAGEWDAPQHEPFADPFELDDAAPDDAGPDDAEPDVDAPGTESPGGGQPEFPEFPQL